MPPDPEPGRTFEARPNGNHTSKQNAPQTSGCLNQLVRSPLLSDSHCFDVRPPLIACLANVRLGGDGRQGCRPSSPSPGRRTAAGPVQGCVREVARQGQAQHSAPEPLAAAATPGCFATRRVAQGRHIAFTIGATPGRDSLEAPFRVGWCAPMAALRRLPRARAIACAPRLALNAHQPTAVANGSGAECLGGAFLSPVSLRISKKKSSGTIFRASPEGVRHRDASNKSARARHPRKIKLLNADSRTKPTASGRQVHYLDSRKIKTPAADQRTIPSSSTKRYGLEEPAKP